MGHSSRGPQWAGRWYFQRTRRPVWLKPREWRHLRFEMRLKRPCETERWSLLIMFRMLGFLLKRLQCQYSHSTYLIPGVQEIYGKIEVVAGDDARNVSRNCWVSKSLVKYARMWRMMGCPERVQAYLKDDSAWGLDWNDARFEAENPVRLLQSSRKQMVVAQTGVVTLRIKRRKQGLKKEAELTDLSSFQHWDRRMLRMTAKHLSWQSGGWLRRSRAGAQENSLWSHDLGHLCIIQVELSQRHPEGQTGTQDWEAAAETLL